MSCDREVTRELTYRFLAWSRHQRTRSWTKSCMGEGANIVGGGNVKALLPRGVDHSVPIFQESRPLGGEALLSVAFHCDAGPLWVSLVP